MSSGSKRRDPFGGNVGKSNHLPQRHVYNDTLDRLFAATKPTHHLQPQQPQAIQQQQQQAIQQQQMPPVSQQHAAMSVYGAQCYVCMSMRPAVECVSCARSTCEHCARQCTRCGMLACALCSQVSYAARFEQTFCFDCFRAEHHRPSPPRASAATSSAATTTAFV
jgi:hypothetical protein